MFLLPWLQPRRRERGPFRFDSAEAFFADQCRRASGKIVRRKGLAALVVNGTQELGGERSTLVRDDGTQLAMLTVAAPDGGFRVPATTLTGNGDRLKPGDLVVWVPMQRMSTALDVLGDADTRFLWSGFIVAKIKPELDLSKSGFEIACRYD